MAITSRLLVPALLLISSVAASAQPPGQALRRTAPKVRLSLGQHGGHTKTPAAETAPSASLSKPEAWSLKPLEPASYPAQPGPVKAMRPEWLRQLIAMPTRFYFWPTSKEKGAWSLSAGFVWRDLGDVSFRSFSTGIASGAPFRLPSATRTENAAIGADSGFGNRSYKDGFVNPDAATPITLDTAHWGYDSRSQVSGNTLSFHADGPSWTTVSQSLSLNDAPAWSDGASTGGPMLTLSYEKPWSKNISLGLDFSASFFQADMAHTTGSFVSIVTVNHFSSRVTDRYEANGLIPPAPFVGNPGAPGALVFASPTRSQADTLEQVDTTVTFDRIREKLDLRLTTLSFGPTGSFKHKRLRGQFGYGLALNVASWRATKEDTVYSGPSFSQAKPIAHWRSAESAVDVLPGFYLQSALSYDLTENWSLGFFGRYDWSRELTGSVGGSDFALDLSGWSAGAMATWRF